MNCYDVVKPKVTELIIEQDLSPRLFDSICAHKGFSILPSPIVWLKQGYLHFPSFHSPRKLPNPRAWSSFYSPTQVGIVSALARFSQALSRRESWSLDSSDTVLRSPSTLNLKGAILEPIPRSTRSESLGVWFKNLNFKQLPK